MGYVASLSATIKPPMIGNTDRFNLALTDGVSGG